VRIECGVQRISGNEARRKRAKVKRVKGVLCVRRSDGDGHRERDCRVASVRVLERKLLEVSS